MNRGRIIKKFDFEWRFIKNDITDAEKVGFDDSDWCQTDIPHDWSIEGPFSEENPSGPRGGYLPAGIGWYRKKFKIPTENEGKRVFIKFDGVYMNSDVWLNGHKLGNRPYGYISFSYDLTPYLNYGDQENVLTVRVDNSAQPGSRWYSGSGIYRHVWLIITEQLHVAENGTYITTPAISESEATINIKTKIRNHYSEPVDCQLETLIVNAENEEIKRVSSDYQIKAIDVHQFEQKVKIDNPQLWSPDKPHLYRAITTVSKKGKIVDTYQTVFGIRDIEFDANKGFILNGSQVKIKGVCLHHDNGPLGAVCLEPALERQLKILKEMGCNAIRTSHNPPSSELLNLCDRHGFLVMDEAFDEWNEAMRPVVWKDGEMERIPIKAYKRFFNEWAKRDLTDMIRRDRNHPSIIIWSVGNEIPESTKREGVNLLKKLVEIVHIEDPTRPATAATVDMEGANEQGFPEPQDIVGYNYQEDMYEGDHQKYPDRVIIGSENRSAPPFTARGDYSKLKERTRDERLLEACKSWKITSDNDYACGLFLWTGFDYLGEPTPYSWPARSSYFGVMDLCGFPKDDYYFYQSQWMDKPMLHIFPHWNWEGEEGKQIPVWCYSNCDSVELFLNDKSLGVKDINHMKDFYKIWQVSYQPGTLKAIGRKDGNIVCEKEITTAGRPTRVVLSSNRDSIKANGQDLVYITVRIEDEEGNLVPEADNLIEFTIEGEGSLVGLGNGDPCSHEDFKASCRKAFNGLCLAIVQSTQNRGELSLTATSSGLSSDSVVIRCED